MFSQKNDLTFFFLFLFFNNGFPSLIFIREKQIRYYPELRMMDLELIDFQSEQFQVALLSSTAHHREVT